MTDQNERMDEIKLKEIIGDFIKNNLSIELNKVRGSYGMSDTVTVKLYLNGEEISCAYLD